MSPERNKTHGKHGAAGAPPSERPLIPRRLKVSHINIVDRPMMRKALGGTIVGNTMEWYDVGVFGYLITTMGPVFLPEADKTVQNLFLLGTFAATFIARPLGGVFFGWLGDKIGRQKVLSMTLDHHGCLHVRRWPAPGVRGPGNMGRSASRGDQARSGVLHRRRICRCHDVRQ